MCIICKNGNMYYVRFLYGDHWCRYRIVWDLTLILDALWCFMILISKLTLFMETSCLYILTIYYFDLKFLFMLGTLWWIGSIIFFACKVCLYLIMDVISNQRLLSCFKGFVNRQFVSVYLFVGFWWLNTGLHILPLDLEAMMNSFISLILVCAFDNDKLTRKLCNKLTEIGTSESNALLRIKM